MAAKNFDVTRPMVTLDDLFGTHRRPYKWPLIDPTSGKGHKYINVTNKEDVRILHGLRVWSGAAIMRKHMNPPKMFIKQHRTPIKVSNHMISWSMNQFVAQYLVFGVLYTQWSTLWLSAIMSKLNNLPKIFPKQHIEQPLRCLIMYFMVNESVYDIMLCF